ncbi:hypothetical protein C8R41DRAFT_914780 [Lentinula lateritia]|uniref:Uncharacterized protein n=1 Tax=Lentinula lateritia TaxID=40482 RepID=A0ABQ8VU77_9AGAR|nr:hypothetical protein C8R41DRAFT_914780 [Lentinula lateritia]
METEIGQQSSNTIATTQTQAQNSSSISVPNPNPNPNANSPPDTMTTTPHLEDTGNNTDTPPRRRKSVRVSLQPTYSVTPPAIEYDVYEDDHGDEGEGGEDGDKYLHFSSIFLHYGWRDYLCFWRNLHRRKCLLLTVPGSASAPPTSTSSTGTGTTTSSTPRSTGTMTPAAGNPFTGYEKVCTNYSVSANMCLQPNIGSDPSWVRKVAAEKLVGGVLDLILMSYRILDAPEFKKEFEATQKTNAALRGGAPAEASLIEEKKDEAEKEEKEDKDEKKEEKK